jgi:hypothetical protein
METEGISGYVKTALPNDCVIFVSENNFDFALFIQHGRHWTALANLSDSNLKWFQVGCFDESKKSRDKKSLVSTPLFIELIFPKIQLPIFPRLEYKKLYQL